MKNFLQVNRALAAEKHINLIEWLQTDSHGKQSATRDHHGTKSRELPDNPRLYRYPCATLALPLRYVAMIFAVLTLSIANIGMAWGDQGVDYSCGFESGTDSWTKSSMASIGSETTNVRTGSKAVVCGCNNASGYARKSVTVHRQSTNYVHFIVWAKSSASTTAQIKSAGGSAVSFSVGTSSWTRMYANTSVTGSSTTSKNMDILPKMTSGSFYFDDAIVYYSTNSTTDLTAPSAATSASATTSSISWSNGSDSGTGATGIQNTTIWRRTSGSSDDLTLNAQGVYTASATDQSGHWTCVSATVGSAATSYDGTFSAGDRYAIVHRDLAYNYSTPTYVTVAAGGGCSAPTIPNISGTTSYTVGQNISLTASATGTSGTTTYTWYKGATWAAASATTPVQAASTSGATFTKASCVAGDAGTYWCNISNGTGCEVQTSQTITVAATHTVTAATENASYGTAAAANTTVAEGATTTITATPEAGYQFDHWTVSGTGATLSSTTTNPTTLTMGTANATVTAYFAEKAADPWIIKVALSGSSGATKTMSGSISGTSTVSGLGSSSPYKIAGDAAYVSLTLASGYFQAGDSVVLDLSKQGQIFWGESDNDAGHLLGTTTSKSSIHYFVLPNTFPANTNTIHVGRTSSTYNGTLTYMAVYRPEKTCTAPNHVDVTGRWDRFAGETISLTATAYSSAGTGSPIAAGSITGYQWQKLVGSTWTSLSNGTTDGVTISGATAANLQIANCKSTNSGKYRCVVSTGATCSTASATATDGSQGLGVKVYTLECYTGGTTSYNFTRVGDTQAGTLQLNLAAGNHTFKFHADGTYYGNNGTINEDVSNWVCSTSQGNLTIAAGLGGTFTINMEYSTSGNSSVEGEPEISVTYPRKTIYLTPGVWNSESAKFAIYYFRKEGETTYGNGWTDFLTANDCGMSAEIPQWNGVKIIPVRLKNTTVSPGSWDDRWNQTNDITVSSYNSVVITGWDAGDYTYNSNFSTPTYTISYNAGTGGSGTKASESKTCGVAFTLPGSTFTYAGHSQDGWATTDGGATAYALSGSYTTNAAQEFFPHWKCNTPTITDNGDNTVTITVPAGTTVRYTTDGTNPTGSTGTVYSSAIDIAANVTVKAIAYQTGCTDSEVASQACTYHAPAGDEHVYYYKDATHYVSSSYKNPEGGAPSGSDNVALTTPWTIRNSTFMTGLTSVVATAARYDNKTNHMNAYIKLRQTDGGKIVFTIASGYTATIKIKMGGYSGKNESITMKLNDSGDNISYSGTMSGAGTTEDNYAQLTYADLAAGAYTLKPTSGSLYISQIDIETEAVAACTAAPTVTAGSNSSVTSTTATVSCASGISALGTGGCTITSYGFVLGTSANPTLSNTVHEVGTTYTTTGTSFSKNLTGLTASTTYYVRPYATNGYGTGYGTQTSFTTSAAAALNDGCWDPANTAADILTSGDVTLTTFDNNFSGVTGITSVTLSKGTGDGKCSGADETPTSSGYLKVKNASSSGVKIITIVTSAAKDITIGGEPYGSNTGSFYLVKSTAESTKLAECNTGATSKATNCPAGTYYVYAKGNSSKSINFSLLCIEDAAPDETAPTFVSSVPANGATDVATSGTIVLTFNEPLGSVDASKFTLTGATKGTVTIDGSDAAKVNITYTGAENSSTVTLATAAAAVSDVAGNALAAALSNISFTTAAAAPAGDCITITNFATTNSSNTLNVYKGTISDANKYLGKTTSSNTVGKNSGADLLLKYKSSITIYNAPAAETNFTNITEIHFDVKANDNTKRSGFEVYVGATKVATISGGDGGNTVFNKDSYTTLDVTGLEQLTGYVRITSTSSSGAAGYDTYIDNIQICTSSLDACTTPALPDLSKQTVCEGSNGTSWNAAITNSGSLVSGESVAYSWVKKGSSTVLSSVATYQPTSVTEAMAGTYVVTATVSADGKASKSASKEVELAVNATVEISGVTQSPATVYAGNSVTLTATANVSATWQWYACTNAEGDGEAPISGATSAAYAFTAPASAGTYYYKVKATGPCGGVATEVYALTVSAATGGECFHFVSVLPASDISVSSGASLVTPTHATTLEGGTMKVGSQQVTFTKDYGLKMEGTKTVSITLESALEAGNVVIVKGTSGTKGYGITINGVNFYDADNKTFDVSYTVLADDGLVGKTALTVSKHSGSSYLQEIKITGCGEACTDPEVTAKVNGASSATLCSGEASFTATDAHASATYQWQKYSGSTWTDISGATNATYTIASVTEGDEGKYRVIATHECARTSNEVTLNVSATPVFGSLGGAREVETGGSLSITNVEASDATSYKWYRSSNNTYEAGTDTQVGTAKNLLLPVNDAAGTTFYLFCVATNTCGNVTSDAINVSVIAAAEKDCAVGTSSGDNFTTAKTSDVNGGSYLGQTELHMGSNNKYIYYTAADGYHFQTATVNCCAGDATALTKAAYGYSTDGGATWTDADLPGAMTNQYSDHVVNLSADVNAFRVGRVLNGKGVGSNTLYVHQVCFTYVADCNATTITVSNASPTYDLVAGGDFTEPTCTVKQGSTALSPQPALRYSSFNEAVATVDPSTGEVDFTGTAGSVVIMASYDGDEDYCASSATYTITVSCGSESAPKIEVGSGTNLSGCNASVSLAVKDQSGNNFASGSYQWYRDGEEIDGATSATYTAERTGTYTVSHTGECTQMSTNSAVVTSESFDPSVERLVPFQYYHADKTYTAQMKDRHLFAVTSGGDYEGKRYYMTATRNGDPLDISASTAFFVRTSIDNRVDTVMIDLNKLENKFSAGDEIVLTCAAIADCGTISAVTEDIELHVIDDTPTLALICSGTNKSAGTRKTGELTVGGDFLTGYNKADLCVQTGGSSFDGSTEWGLYTKLKEHYLVTPVNGYAVFNKLNYEPFDICFLTDYPKSSKSAEAATVLDDMADLCDYRPLFSFKTHMVAKQPSKWAAKGFTTTAEVPKQSRLRLNITCYAHPMFKDIKGSDVARDYDDGSQIVYTMLTGAGYESSKGMQGFHLAAAENFVTIGLVHYNATAEDNYGGTNDVKWTPGSGDEMLVAAAERQENIEARMIFFSLNCGAQSKLTAQGETVVMECLEYLLNDATIEGNLSDCSLTFDNKAGDGNWNTPGNWGPDHVTVPGQYNAARIAAPATVDIPHAKALELRIMDGGSVTIPAGSGLEIKSTIRHLDGKTVSPTEENDIRIGAGAEGNGTLIFNNTSGDTKAHVGMYSKGFIDYTTNPKGDKNYQYMGVPCVNINALYNYYGSWIYSWSDKGSGYGWKKVVNGGIVTTWTGYCITQERAGTYYDISGTLAATTTVDIPVPAGENMVVGNSWTAPISIGAFADDDFENLLGNVYFFNAGVDKDYTSGHKETADKYAPSTYVTVPIHAADYTGTSDHIPSLQGFFVKNTSGSDGVLHLDYDRHVRGTTRDNILSGPMHAPKRAQATDTDEPVVLKIKVSGENYDDKLVLLAREDFSEGFDNGWDGDKWDGNESALYLYTTDSEGTENSVSAVPELEGTVIGFRAGEDDEYTMYFDYQNGDERLYLWDTETGDYTVIKTGYAYAFTTADKEKHARFIITRSNGQDVSTDITSTASQGEGAKAKKLLIGNKMYIMVDGRLFDATGKVVK